MNEITCPRCEKELPSSLAYRTNHTGNSLFEVPNTTEKPDTPACFTCCTRLEDEGKIELPEERNIEDCHVYYETQFGWIAEAIVLREDWTDPRGNILGEYLGPAPDDVQPDEADPSPILTREDAIEAGEDLVILTYDSVQVISDGTTTP